MKKKFKNIVTASLAFCMLTVLMPEANAQQITVSLTPLSYWVDDLFTSPPIIQPLITGSKEFHHFHLRPSHLKQLKQSETLIWLGVQSENKMMKTIESRHFGFNNIRLVDHLTTSQNKSLTHLTLDQEAHLWLAVELMQTLHNHLHATLKANSTSDLILSMEQLNQNYTQWKDHWRLRFANIKTVPFIIDHDAIQPLVKTFELNQVGTISSSTHNPPSIKKLAALRSLTEELKITCYMTTQEGLDPWSEKIFSKPINPVYLDLFGVNKTSTPLWQKSKYLGFLNQILLSIEQCLHKA